MIAAGVFFCLGLVVWGGGGGVCFGFCLVGGVGVFKALLADLSSPAFDQKCRIVRFIELRIRLHITPTAVFHPRELSIDISLRVMPWPTARSTAMTPLSLPFLPCSPALWLNNNLFSEFFPCEIPIGRDALSSEMRNSRSALSRSCLKTTAPVVANQYRSQSCFDGRWQRRGSVSRCKVRPLIWP